MPPTLVSALVVAANRGPVSIEVGGDGALRRRKGAGGLAPSLAQALAGHDAAFVAAAMTEGERRVATGEAARGVAEFELGYVVASPELREQAYGLVANQTLWFLYHGLFDAPRRPLFDRSFHEAFAAFRRYNELFAEEISRRADVGATVVVHDYHLALVGGFLREQRPDLASVHFTHTPFCTPDELTMLPSSVARELVAGLADFGACGFHCARWRDRFAASAASLGLDPPELFVEPLGVDAPALRAALATGEVATRAAELEAALGGRRLIARADRIEPSKNILRGFLAFEELLADEPARRGGVVFVAHCYASRTDLAEYRRYRQEIEEVVEHINRRFATPEWEPIVLDLSDDYAATLAALRRSEVLLVNPVRDGMNLVAKEGAVLNERSGALVLSREAGVADELGEAAFVINPFDVSATAAALGAALDLAPSERAKRAAVLAARSSLGAPGEWHERLAACARVAGRR